MHFMNDRKMEVIRKSGAAIAVHIALKDELMKPKDQKELAKLLHVQPIVFDGGHMGSEKDKERFFELLLSHLKKACEVSQ